MDSNYDKSLKFILRWEGGYSNDPVDPGGATNYGVTQKAYNLFRKLKNRVILAVRNISLDEVGEIYRKAYWEKSGCVDAGWPIDIVLFDTAVNCGVSRAINWRRLTSITAKTDQEVAAGIIQLRRDHYESIIRANPKLIKYRKGWMNRLEALKEEALG